MVHHFFRSRLSLITYLRYYIHCKAHLNNSLLYFIYFLYFGQFDLNFWRVLIELHIPFFNKFYLSFFHRKLWMVFRISFLELNECEKEIHYLLMLLGILVPILVRFFLFLYLSVIFFTTGQNFFQEIWKKKHHQRRLLLVV